MTIKILIHYLFYFSLSLDPPDLHSFPTRRSSDLTCKEKNCKFTVKRLILSQRVIGLRHLSLQTSGVKCDSDRKSTRLNSSHVSISYAVFCLKKKKMHTPNTNYTLR